MAAARYAPKELGAEGRLEEVTVIENSNSNAFRHLSTLPANSNRVCEGNPHGWQTQLPYG